MCVTFHPWPKCGTYIGSVMVTVGPLGVWGLVLFEDTASSFLGNPFFLH